MADGRAIGVVIGDPTVYGFTMKVLGKVGLNEFVELFHDGFWYVLMVKNLRRSGEDLLAECEVLGQPPPTPFKSGDKVFLGSERNVRRILGLTSDESASIYLGLLKGYNYKIYLPIKRITRIFVVGKPGSGKSYTVGVLIEEFLKKGIPIIVIDVHGEYSSLKVPAESGSEEFGTTPRSYTDFIIEFGDLRFNPTADIDISELKSFPAEDLVLAGKCIIINLRGLDEKRQVTIVREVAEKLLDAAIRRQIIPFYLIVDEAHRFAGRDRVNSLPILKKFSQEGRKFGANLIVVTQRPQLLDTTIRSLSGTWIIHRLTDPNDVRIAVEGGGLSRGWERDISWLNVGEAIVTGEVIERIPIIVRVRCRETMHGGAGFNPLKYISKDELESAREKAKLLLRRSSEKVEVEKPKIAPIIDQFFLKVKFNGETILEKLRKRWNYSFELEDESLHYYPALSIHATIIGRRSRPQIELSSKYTCLIPVLNGMKDLDWLSKSAFNVKEFETEDLSSEPESHEKLFFSKIAEPLSSLSGFRKLLEDFISFLTLTFKFKVYYSPKFKIYSKPGESYDSFISRINMLEEKLLKENAEKISEKYSGEIEKHESKLRLLKDQLSITGDVVKKLIRELKILQNQIKTCKREEKYLKISSKIRSRELKLARLNKHIEELTIKIRREQKVVSKLKEERDLKLKEIEASSKNQGNPEVKTILIKIGRSNIHVDSFKLIWIPFFNAQLKISNGTVNRILSVKWNGFNGQGVFGTCIQCGRAFKKLDELNLCAICLAPICEEHSIKCEKCGRTVCEEHSWRCDICGGTFCSEEKFSECSICGAKLCSNCEKHCVNCGLNITYCPSHIQICEECGLPYCEKHYKEHLKKCPICGEEVCKLSLTKCDICGRDVCPNCIRECSICGSKVCLEDSWKCDICGKTFCSHEEKYICSICGKTICKNDAYTCPSCGRTICKAHAVQCPNCGALVCPSCLITVKKFFRIKRGCKLCLSP